MGALRILYVLQDSNLLHNIHLILQFIQEATTWLWGSQQHHLPPKHLHFGWGQGLAKH
jgi:hypothetical protein